METTSLGKLSNGWRGLAPELDQLERLIEESGGAVSSETLTCIDYQSYRIPIKACYLGCDSPDVPVLVITGGVHGLERIGSQVVLAFLETLVRRLRWDASLVYGLENLRLVFIPIVNPVGIIRQTRCNGKGVDLMRNAPLQAEQRVPLLVGGQRLSAHLPWYRGAAGEAMQVESIQLCRVIEHVLSRSPFTLSVDVHSGYGFSDRLWFPLACSRRPIEHLPEIGSLYHLLQTTYPNLEYVVEPQSHHYLTHGDLWDYLYLQSLHSGGIFLPLTLEMGSWKWVRKNWRQTRNLSGWFNPVKPHRVQRVLRRHTILLEFLIRAVRSYANWVPKEAEREQFRQEAIRRWYRGRNPTA